MLLKTDVYLLNVERRITITESSEVKVFHIFFFFFQFLLLFRKKEHERDSHVYIRFERIYPFVCAPRLKPKQYILYSYVLF